MAKTFPNLISNINSHIKEAQQNPDRINMKKSTPCYIMNKLLKTSDREKVSKQPGDGEEYINYRG